MEKFSIRSVEHRANEAMFWAAVEGAQDKHRAKLAMKAALQNASDTLDAEWGFWDCAYHTFSDVYCAIVDYYPSQYRMGKNGHARRIK
jgi:hypothetical protein